MNALLPAIVAGTAQGVPIFVIASGLTLIYGVMHVLNFAHGAFFLVGAYVVTTVLRGSSMWAFFLAALIAGVVVMAVGIVCEVVVFRRLYKAGPLVGFLGAFALFLTIGGLAVHIWGNNPRTVAYPDGLGGSISIAGSRIAVYDLVVVGVGLLIAVALWGLLTHTSIGVRVRALSHDRAMASALGIRAPRVGTLVFAIGSFLAGIAGALITPVTSIDTSLSASYLIPAFIVVIVGGLGSVPGALVAAVALGVIDSLLFRYVPALGGFSYYLLVAVILMVRPQGLFGRTSRTTQIAR
ncbi:amino acid/amide ABC transporter membrane protein 1 (HAAT family) [Jatrophihabitans sp. GAS493]|uniref:branched-chain amino acid ABC transporter permease n=1 Tax=Jatrophihabitans sp. GAS493 TaxID=1907575 RepID=UPI000BB935E3|nr:branched-chain amino acid ABC transporter permease [Jatrophihabitans sp. GAS493]SOD74668.1 amino acid/amide ABC transporter membrane protein 1 (HAAT family) [Jatrophihabitans sp. GAS493]